MKFLVDMPVSPRVAAWLREEGHDALHASECDLSRAADRDVIERAVNEARVVITADTDFPQLLALSREAAPGVVLLRGGDYSSVEMVALLRRVLEVTPAEALQHSICVVDRQRVRYRRLPITPD